MAEDQAQLVFVGVALAGSTWHRIRDTHFADLTDDFGLGVAIGWAQKVRMRLRLIIQTTSRRLPVFLTLIMT